MVTFNVYEAGMIIISASKRRKLKSSLLIAFVRGHPATEMMEPGVKPRCLAPQHTFLVHCLSFFNPAFLQLIFCGPVLWGIIWYPLAELGC